VDALLTLAGMLCAGVVGYLLGGARRKPVAPPELTHEERVKALGGLGAFLPREANQRTGGHRYSFPAHWSADDCAKVIEAAGRAEAAQLEAFGRAVHGVGK
jgi:hypothetical protein